MGGTKRQRGCASSCNKVGAETETIGTDVEVSRRNAFACHLSITTTIARIPSSLLTFRSPPQRLLHCPPVFFHCSLARTHTHSGAYPTKQGEKEKKTLAEAPTQHYYASALFPPVEPRAHTQPPDSYIYVPKIPTTSKGVGTKRKRKATQKKREDQKVALPGPPRSRDKHPISKPPFPKIHDPTVIKEKQEQDREKKRRGIGTKERRRKRMIDLKS